MPGDLPYLELRSTPMKHELVIFEGYKIRRIYDEVTETWFFSVANIIQVLTHQPTYQGARTYWKVLKNRLSKGAVKRLQNVTG